jgi:hypothetical protein
MECEKHEYQNIDDRVSMNAESPLRFFVFGVQKETGEKLYRKKENEENAADSVKEPNEHSFAVPSGKKFVKAILLPRQRDAVSILGKGHFYLQKEDIIILR